MFSRQVLRAARVARPQRLVAVAPVRTFAAAAATEVKAPVQVFGVDGTYATALVRPCPTPNGGIWRRIRPIGQWWMRRETPIRASCETLVRLAKRAHDS